MTVLFALLIMCGIGVCLSGWAAVKWHEGFGWLCFILCIAMIEVGSKIMSLAK